MASFLGMTTNERLFAANLLESFDATIQRRDFEGAVALLIKVEISPAGAEEIVTTIFANPEKYGYMASG